jgi:hypothetical protein
MLVLRLEGLRWHSSNIKGIISTSLYYWGRITEVCLAMASCGMIYIPRFKKIEEALKQHYGFASSMWEAAVLV